VSFAQIRPNGYVRIDRKPKCAKREFLDALPQSLSKAFDGSTGGRLPLFLRFIPILSGLQSDYVRS